MSKPPSTGATELGETRKIFAGTATGRAMRDLDNTGEVFLLATEIADGNSRRASLLSIHESRAIASFAAGAGVILHLAIELVDASDRNAAPKEIRARLQALCAATRAITKKGNHQ
jgi:hypothetical protein